MRKNIKFSYLSILLKFIYKDLLLSSISNRITVKFTIHKQYSPKLAIEFSRMHYWWFDFFFLIRGIVYYFLRVDDHTDKATRKRKESRIHEIVERRERPSRRACARNRFPLSIAKHAVKLYLQILNKHSQWRPMIGDHVSRG